MAVVVGLDDPTNEAIMKVAYHLGVKKEVVVQLGVAALMVMLGYPEEVVKPVQSKAPGR
jgi:hypothetical protein